MAAFVAETLHVTHYQSAIVNLNGDAREETLVYATDRDHCGSGGCDLFIVSPHGSKYQVVLQSSVTRLPIRLLDTSTYGWRDIGVMVGGGGILPYYEARLRFDGHRYPSNPPSRRQCR